MIRTNTTRQSFFKHCAALACLLAAVALATTAGAQGGGRSGRRGGQSGGGGRMQGGQMQAGQGGRMQGGQGGRMQGGAGGQMQAGQGRMQGAIPMRPPDNNKQRYTLSGVYQLLDGTSKTVAALKVSSPQADVSAVYVANGSELTLTNATLQTSGNTSSQQNSSFYGLNAGVLAAAGGKIRIVGGMIDTTGEGANGAFAVDAGSSVSLANLSIRATGGGGHGVMATRGGKMALHNVNIVTLRERAGAIATDRGGGTIDVHGGTVTTAGNGSPGIYSTGAIACEGTTFTSTGAEGAVIEGKNSIALTNVHMTGMSRCAVMIYQSFSGDAAEGSGVFTMQGGALTATTGPAFYVTNTAAKITLNGVKLTAKSGVLLDVRADRWGRSGANGGSATLTVGEQALAGNVTCDSLSTVALNLRSHSTLTGAIDKAAVSLDATSSWNVTADSTLGIFLDPAGLANGAFTNVIGNGHTVRYDPAQPRNAWLGGKTYDLAQGGRLVPAA